MKYYLEIKEPCHESWEKMSPTDKGKFCAACEKEVIDFTKINDRDVLSTLKNVKGNICGRIQQQRLNHAIDIENSKSTFKNVKQFAASFLLLNFVLDSSGLKAQNVSDTVVINDTRWKGQPEVIKTGNTEKIIRGTIRDEQTGEILIGATVLIQGLAKGSSVDVFTEEFVLVIPSQIKDSIELKISYVAYEPQTIKLSLENLPERLDIGLNVLMMEFMGVMSFTPKQRIKNFFRRIFNPGYYD